MVFDCDFSEVAWHANFWGRCPDFQLTLFPLGTLSPNHENLKRMSKWQQIQEANLSFFIWTAHWFMLIKLESSLGMEKVWELNSESLIFHYCLCLLSFGTLCIYPFKVVSSFTIKINNIVCREKRGILLTDQFPGVYCQGGFLKTA